MTAENLERVKTQMRRGVLELCILSILSEKEAYASDIIKRLEDAQLIVVEGTVYPLLSRLKGSGLLRYRWEESNAGPPRKYYCITEEGRTFAQVLLSTWNQLVNAVDTSTKNLSNDE
jgi:PadR family transcriptional regulator PadR